MRRARSSKKVDTNVVGHRTQISTTELAWQILFSSSPEFDFPVKDHAELGESLGIIDFRYIHVPRLQSDSVLSL